MKNFQKAYKDQAGRLSPVPSLINQTCYLMEIQQERQAHTRTRGLTGKLPVGAIIAICLLCLLLAIPVTVYAVKLFQPPATPHIVEETPKDTYVSQDESAAAQDEESNLDIKILNTAADKDYLYVTFEVRSFDGEPFYKGGEIKILDETEFYKHYESLEEYQYFALKFQKVKAQYDGQVIEGIPIRIDDGSKDNYARYEFIGWGDLEGIEQGEATITFTDFVWEVYPDEDHGFTDMEGNPIDAGTREDHLDKIYAPGEWELPIVINASGSEIFSPKITVPDEDMTFTLNTVELSNLQIILRGTVVGEAEKMGNVDELYLIFKDGSRELASDKGSAGSLGAGTFSLDWMFMTVKNATDIVSIEWMGTIVELR